MSEEESFNQKCEKVLAKWREADPYYEQRIEFGIMLTRHIDSFTPEERERFDELNEFLKQHPFPEKKE